MAKSIVTVIGARPQFVKAAVVSQALAAKGVSETLVHTGQHHDTVMSEVFFQELGIPSPTHNLGIAGGSHGQQTGAMLVAVEAMLLGLGRLPDWVLVYGDTNSTLAGALAAAKLHIPVAHVEAGLRSFNRKMPEEINRIMTDHLSSIAFCPTDAAVINLFAEGIGGKGGNRCEVHQVGDVMLDAARRFRSAAAARPDLLCKLGRPNASFVLATIHRAENTDDPSRLLAIVAALRELAKHIVVLWPIHPRTMKCLLQAGIDLHAGEAMGDLIALPPLGYLDMLSLESRARCVVTDSGGVQKEAYFAGVPCITVRDETEWTELVQSGWNTLVSPNDIGSICQSVLRSKPGDSGCSFYGAGTAAERIADLLSRS